jgi:uncharacterized Zn-finger protein
MPDGSATQAPAPVIPTETIPSETIYVDDRTVACDGGDGALGHPRVFLRIAGTQVTCPYCSRRFVLNPGAGGGEAH